MPKKPVDKDPVYTWIFQSSKTHGGQITNYVTRLKQDGALSCDCPGWIFAKKGQERACKHTRVVVVEVKEIMRKWAAGEPLQLIDMSQGFSSVVSSTPNKVANIKYGRVLDLET